MTFEISPVLANIIGPELLVVVGIAVLLFGGSQIPKLARSLGQASKEFKAGQDDATSEKKRDGGGPAAGNPQSPSNPEA